MVVGGVIRLMLMTGDAAWIWFLKSSWDLTIAADFFLLP